MEGIGVLFVLGFGIIALVAGVANRGSRIQAWRRAASAAGLTHVSVDEGIFNSRLTGTSGPHVVRLEAYSRGKHESGTRIVIGGLGYRSQELTLSRETFGKTIGKVIGGDDIQIGEKAFDASAYILGSMPLVRALLDAPTRRALSPLFQGEIPCGDRSGDRVGARVAVSDGELRAEIPGRGFGGSHGRLPEVLKTLLAAAGRLRRPEDIPGRLAENVRRDPVPGVRVANLVTLVRQYPNIPETRAALKAGLEDPSDEVRLKAAIALGDEGRVALLEIASRSEGPDGPAVQAIAALGKNLPIERAGRILDGAIDRGRTRVALAAIEALGRIGGTRASKPLIGALDSRHEDLAAAAAKSLGACGDPAAEAPLIAALEREEGVVRTAAAAALGRLGTAASVVPLRIAAAGHPFDLTLRRAAREAIARIQSRLPGASPGQLSLAAGEEGKLTLADDGQSGEVTLSDGT
jgi:hypothetical protein